MYALQPDMPITLGIMALQSSNNKKMDALGKQITGGYKNGHNLLMECHTELQFAPSCSP